MRIVGDLELVRQDAAVGKFMRCNNTNGRAEWADLPALGLSSLPYWQVKTTDGPDKQYSIPGTPAHNPLDTSKWRITINCSGKPLLIGGQFLVGAGAVTTVMGINMDGSPLPHTAANGLAMVQSVNLSHFSLGPIVVVPTAGIHNFDVTAWAGGIVYDRAAYEANAFWVVELTGGIGPQGPVGTVPGHVTSLPASPVDGQECYYVASAAEGIVWHLKYRAASTSPHKWECVGAAPWTRNPDTQVTNVGGAHVDIPGCSLTAPLKGDYNIAFGGSGSNQVSTGLFLLSMWIANAQPLTEEHYVPLQNAIANGWVHGSREGTFPVAAANSVIKVAGYSWNGICQFGIQNSYGFPAGWLKVLPVRVS